MRLPAAKAAKFCQNLLGGARLYLAACKAWGGPSCGHLGTSATGNPEELRLREASTSAGWRQQLPAAGAPRTNDGHGVNIQRGSETCF